MSSAWELQLPAYPVLESDTTSDVAIIGGGLCGVWCAYELSKRGVSVVLLEANRLGRAATLYTTAFITNAVDTSLTELVSIFGEEKAGLAWRSHYDAIGRIEQVIEEEGIDCEFLRLPMMLYATSDTHYQSLEAERDWAEKFRFETKLRRNIATGFAQCGVWQIEHQAKYHPMKFFRGLVEACVRQGVRFYEKSEVRDVDTEGEVHVKTKDGHTVRAHDVIVATYKPLDNTKTHLKKGMYTSYVYGLEIPHESLPEGLYQDLANPYHYIRVDACEDKDRMLVGGEDHRAELGFMRDKSFAALEDFVKETFPNLTYSIKNRWQGGILEPIDGLALIGRVNPHEYVATAFSGNGMTYSCIAGVLLPDLILNKTNPWQDIYDPTRSLSAKAIALKGRDYGEEFLGGAVKNLFK